MNTAIVFTIIAFILIHSINTYSCARSIDPDEGRDALEIITSRGFKAEAHYVVTDDGYILGLHRIVNPNSVITNYSKPILLQHGLLGSSTDWLINTPFVSDFNNQIDDRFHTEGYVGNNLGFVLSQKGYDVWLSNSRGNTYSTNHTQLSPKANDFWRFTFDEMIEYDLTATIKYIQKHTNNTSIGYIGHSQGTVIMFGLLSSKPEYAQIIDPFIALAPVAYVGQIESPIKYFSRLAPILKRIGGAFLPSDRFTKFIADKFCDDELRFICSNFLFLMAGFDKQELNMTRLGVYFNHTPAGTSSWNIAHFGQLVESKTFRKFDFGAKDNILIYGQKYPPDYPLSDIKSEKIALIYSSNDWLADMNDVSLLKQQLKVPLLDDYLVPFKDWSHTDFIFGKDAGKYVYSRVLDILSKNYNRYEQK